MTAFMFGARKKPPAWIYLRIDPEPLSNRAAQKRAGSRLGPILAARVETKPNVSAGRRDLEMKTTVLSRLLNGIAFLCQKRIVARVHKQRWHSNVFQELLATAFAPVVLGIFETMNRRSVTIVEVFEIPKPSIATVVDLPRHHLHHRPDLYMQGDEKTLHINPVHWLRQLDRTGLQIAWNRERHGRLNPRIQLMASFPKIFQRQVATKTKPDQRDPRIIISRCNMRDYCMQIFGCATVSEPQDSIRFTAAAARVP